MTFTSKRPLYAGAIYGAPALSLSTIKPVSAFPNTICLNDPSPKLYFHSRVKFCPSTTRNGFGGLDENAGALPDEK